MPNIGSVLKQEITRLSRREARGEVESTRRASAHYRKEIAELKRKVTALEQKVALLSRRTLDRPAAPASAAEDRQLRYSAKGLQSQRRRLGFSASDYGRLLGVSAHRVNRHAACADPKVRAKSGFGASAEGDTVAIGLRPIEQPESDAGVIRAIGQLLHVLEEVEWVGRG